MLNSKLLASLLALALSLGAFNDADAKRIGGGGMKRTVPQQTAPGTPAKPAAPAQQAAPQQQAAPAPAAAPAAPPKRSWMGPLAGLAAGLGLAALASHFGFGAELASFMTMALIALVVMMVIGFVMRRFAAAKQAQAAYAGGAGGYAPVQRIDPAPVAAAAVAAPAVSQEDAEFSSLAKKVFIRLQAANDAGDQADLRRFTTPEMYASIQQELLDRKGATQQTEVLQLDAAVIDRALEDGQQVVSVRFWGLVRERSEEAAGQFDEVWHLVRPQDSSRDWAIAGIQPSQH
ncbi:Tim44-like domain-containing protein [Pelomonas sp. SE-A7]|uniref:Tim44 domain-containing protein n=1 Tax=Pelomonas sp. SE-A7 TaxID=3054953 RepID=UPI00259CE2C2|nr:Tim44-like domain-containing protein [Pelomonas sp. SE-A7]MDM4767079.1 Tim44-like domain-containing protein [Pelomonas sp. SE-A7]